MIKSIFLIFLLLASSGHAGIWSLKSTAEPVDPKDKTYKVNRSVLQFSTIKGKTLSYKPLKEPWGMTRKKEVTVHGKTYFITYWPAGTLNLHFKIFNPDEAETPLCEFTSDAEETRLRFNKNLEYELSTRELAKDATKAITKIKKSWKPCSLSKKTEE